MKMLFRFQHEQGLGDAVALTSVLRHVRHYHPDARIELIVLPGREPLYRGLADEIGASHNLRRAPTHEIVWQLPRVSYAGHPSTFVEKYLLEGLRLQPLPELCRYQIEVDAGDRQLAREGLRSLVFGLGNSKTQDPRPKTALLHYRGVSMPADKDLTDQEAAAIAIKLTAAGYRVLVLDQSSRSPLVEQGLAERVPVDCLRRQPTVTPDGRPIKRPLDAGLLTGLIAEVDLFLGVDSGPLHVAAALDTPTIGLWTRHHPLHCICPSDNAVHLIRRERGHPEPERFLIHRPIGVGLEFFEAHYHHAFVDDFADAIDSILPRLTPDA